MDYYDGAGYKVEDMHYFDVYVPSVMEVWESCMRPSIVQIVQYMATFFLWNIAFRLTSQTGESFMPFTLISIYIHIYSFETFIHFHSYLLGAQIGHTVDIPRGFQHIASIVCGMAISYFTLGLDSLYSLGFTTITYLLFFTITRMNLKHYGVTLTFFCLVSLTIGCVCHIILSCSWMDGQNTRQIY